MISVLNTFGIALAGVVVMTARTPGVSAQDLSFDPAIQTVGIDGKLVTLESGNRPHATPRAPGLAGWSSPQLIYTYYNWDNWDLNSHIGLDDLGNVQAGMRLWEYNNRVLTYDRWAFDPGGESLGEWLAVYGIGDGPAFEDFIGGNFALQPNATTQWFSLVDDSDNIHMFSTSSSGTGWEIIYRKLDPAGIELIPWTAITTYAYAWNFYLTPFLKHDGTIGVIWIRDTDDIVCTTTSDGGATWTAINTLIDRDGTQGTGLKAAVADDDSLHIVYRVLDWGTSDEGVFYAKFRPDFSVAVGETKFYDGLAQYPNLALDDGGWLHVMWHTVYDVGTQLFYTRLRGDLDLDGAASTDTELSVIQEYAFVTDALTVRYPISVTTPNKLHVVYQNGTYGRGQDKNLYYITLSPVPGDMNCDGDIDTDDVAPFVLALMDTDEFAAQYYGCEAIRADINGDASIDGLDISGFLDILLQVDDE